VVFEKTLRILALCAGAVLMGLMGLIVFDVVMRYGLRIPFLGAYEMTELAMALIVFLALPYCAATDGHVAVDVLGPWLDRPAFRWLNVLIPFAGSALAGVMAWESIGYAFDTRARGDLSNMMRIDLFPFQLAAGLSLALFCAVLAHHAWKALRK
jgi:TRAP-type C4-dicarboxylate transport system permease small subunit